MATSTFSRLRKWFRKAIVTWLTASPCQTLCAIQCPSGYSTSAGSRTAAAVVGEVRAGTSVSVVGVNDMADLNAPEQASLTAYILRCRRHGALPGRTHFLS